VVLSQDTYEPKIRHSSFCEKLINTSLSHSLPQGTLLQCYIHVHRSSRVYALLSVQELEQNGRQYSFAEGRQASTSELNVTNLLAIYIKTAT
jgi:hypothetical protein